MELASKDVASYSFLTVAASQIAGRNTGTTTLHPKSRISVGQIRRGLAAVSAASGFQDAIIEERLVLTGLTNIFQDEDNSTTLRDWYHVFEDACRDDGLRQCLNLTIGLRFLLQCGRSGLDVPSPDLDFVWALIYGALTSESLKFKAVRSALGYYSVPLWSLKQEDDNIDELFRLHVWIPDDHEKRTTITNIHTHQAYGQGWILTEQGTDYLYNTKPATEGVVPTHTEYSITWNVEDARSPATKALAQQLASSTVTNKKKPVRAVRGLRRTHPRGTSYTISEGTYHALDVAPDELHATLFLFDSQRGFLLDAPALGPLDGSNATLERQPASATVPQLAKTVLCLRLWEDYCRQANLHIRAAEWERALSELKKAERLCEILDGEPHSPLKHAPRYRRAVQNEIGHAYRMIGKNELAREALLSAEKGMSDNLQRIEILGELSVVYRHENNLEESGNCSRKAYDISNKLLISSDGPTNPAIRLKLKKEMCRAIGDLGMVNYQLFLVDEDPERLSLAMAQLNERIDIARKLKDSQDLQSLSAKEKEELIEYCSQREAIALARLSLCYTEAKETDKAIEAAWQALNIQQTTQKDPTKTAFSRYFYGRALLRAGRQAEAVDQFNPKHNECTPTIALCKEGSDEHRGYIKEMIDAGADMELRDEHGYSALECAVYCGDQATIDLIEDGLRMKFMIEAEQRNQNLTGYQRMMAIQKDVEQKIDRLRYEANIRRGYRYLVQDTLRPVLLQGQGSSALDQVRNGYAQALQDVNKGRKLFDTLKVVYYTDFVACGRLPRHGDKFTKEIIPENGRASTGEYIIFMSYRWLGVFDIAKGGATPDDDDNTQYKRMLRALDDFTKKNPQVDKRKLCIWLDYACVEQKHDVLNAAGVVSLPLSLAQCNAMISLIDETYYERAWCLAEILMIQTLRKSYKFHKWYEDKFDEEKGGRTLQEPVADILVNMAEAKVTFETDRPTLLFLERQTKLLE